MIFISLNRLCKMVACTSHMRMLYYKGPKNIEIHSVKGMRNEGENEKKSILLCTCFTLYSQHSRL